jgi:uncharacterized protein YwgA
MGNLPKVIACLKKLGYAPKMDDFQSKLIVQKVVYLLQSMGIKSGFSYSLYVRGTYSPDLTRDLYEHRADAESLKSNEKLTEQENKKIEEFNEVMQQRLTPSILEIAAAYAYLAYEQKMPSKGARIKLKEIKPYFSETEYTIGINRAKELIFKPTEEDLRKLREEMKGWDAATDEDSKKLV